MSAILVMNAGSSSMKYQLIDTQSETRLATGLVERIGSAHATVVHKSSEHSFNHTAEIRDHAAAFTEVERVFAHCGTPLAQMNLLAVGHRVVQGGEHFIAPTLIDDEVAAKILELADLAPLHNPAHYQAIQAARQVFPQVPHVAVFDTAFHQTLPPKAYTYAIDAKIARDYGVRRYGFHGTSHQIVSRRAAKFAGIPLDNSKQIVLHLGNGASACAVLNGRSVDTSMGLTPLQGLVMGTRSGDIDPSVVFHLAQQASLELDEINELLNKGSGLYGMAGSNDFRDVRAAAESGDLLAQRALEVYAYRIRHYIGAYYLELGGLDTLVFTAGLGENAPLMREMVCEGLGHLGIELDREKNRAMSSEKREISAPGSQVKVLVIPTDEELEIARQVRTVTE